MRLNRILIIAAPILFAAFFTRAQNNSVAIGQNTTDPSAVLLLVGNGSQGLIIPKVTTLGSFGKAAMLVYNTSDNKVYYSDGTTWSALGGSGSASQSISISGNTITVGSGSGTSIGLVANPQGDQFMVWNGTAWVGAKLSGDATNALGALTVTGLRGKQLPANFSQGVLTSDANGNLSWTPATGTVPTLSNGQILTGNGTNNSATPLTGDASLSAGALKVTGIQGKAIPVLPTTSSVQLLSYNGTTNQWEFKDPTGANLMLKPTYDPTGKAADVFDLANHSGILPLSNGGTGISNGTPGNDKILSTNGTGTVNWSSVSGDISLASGVVTVKQLNGKQLPAFAAGALTSDASGNLSWAPASGLGTVTSIAGGTGLTGGTITTSGTLAVDVGTGANQIPQLDNAGKLNVSTLPATVPLLSGGKLATSVMPTGVDIDASDDITTATVAGGDLSGTYPNPTVSKIQGSSWPSNSAGVLTNNGGGTLSWIPAGTGTVTNVTGTAPINVATGTSTPVISLANTAVAPGSYGTTTSIPQIAVDAQGRLTSAANVSIPTANTTTTGLLSGTDWTTFNSKQGTLNLTTTGTSGAATLVGNTLNIPNYAGTIYTAGTGLTLTAGAFSVNTSQNISTLSNLTSNGLIKTSGGVGTLSIATAGTDYVATEADPTVKAINGLVKSDGTTISVAVAGTDYVATETDPTVKAINGLVKSNGTTIGAVVSGTDIKTINSTSLLGSGNITVVATESDPTVKAISGIVKSNGTTISAAVAGTDYVATETDPTVKAISGIVKSNGTTISSAVAGTDYAPATTGSSMLKGNGSGGFSNAAAGTDYQTPLGFSTGLTNTAGTITVNTSQNISTLSNLSTKGLVTTTAAGVLGSTQGTGLLKDNGTGTISYDNSTYLTGNQTITLSGDVTGTGTTAITTTVSKVNGSTWPANTSGVLTNDGSGILTWAPTGGTGTVTGITGGIGLIGGTINVAGTLDVDVGTTANKIVQLDGTGKLPAVDGSQLTNLPTISLTTTGNSGAASLVGSSLNVPNYTLSGLGGISLTSLSATAPLTYNSVTGGFGISNAAADGTTKGVASFATNDFDATAGNISLDYTNGQAATSTTKGFLSSADWTTFNSKQGAITLTTTGTSGAATLVGNTLNIPNYAGTTYSAGTGLTLTTGVFSVNTSQNISTLSNLTSNGLIKTSGGVGTLSIATAGTDYVATEADPTVKAISGIVKSNGTTISAAVAGTDYLTPFGSQTANFIYAAPSGSAGVPTFRAITTLDIPTLNQNTTGSAGSLTNALSVDNSSLQLSAGTSYNGSSALTMSVKASGITNAMLAGSIAASKLIGTDINTVGTVTSGVWNGTKISETFGGTNQTTYATGDILYASASNVLSKLPIGTANQVLTVSGGVPLWASSTGWSLTGNATTTPGTNFVGTTDAQDLVFKTNSVENMRMLSTGNVGIGTSTPTQKLEISHDDNNGGIVLNRANAGTAKSEIKFNKAGVQRWVLGVDFSQNDGQDFFIWDQVNLRKPFWIDPTGVHAYNNDTAGGSYALSGVSDNPNDVAGFFYNTATTGGTSSHGIYAGSEGLGAGVFGAAGTSSSGSGGIFANWNPANSAPVVQIWNNGTGTALEIGTYAELHDNYLSIKTAGGNSYKSGIKLRNFDDTDGFTLVSDETINQFQVIRHPSAAQQVALAINRLDGFVGIGTTTPVSKLDVSGDLHLSQITAPSPVTDKLYNVGGNLFWNGTNLSSGSGWSLTGNDISTSPGSFIGTISDNPLSFKMNNLIAGQIGSQTSQNTSYGLLSHNALTTGVSSTAIGFFALNQNTTGSNNTAIGTNALRFNQSGNSNTAVGMHALLNNTVDGNTAVGYQALTLNTSGTANTAVGSASLQSNTTGYSNSALGSNALLTNTTGFVNVAMGTDVLRFNSTGAANSGFGAYSLAFNSTGNNNSALGTNALNANTTGFQNTAIGTQALQTNTVGNNNTASGFYALNQNASDNNVANGSYALFSNTTGTANTAIGFQAGYTATSGNANTTGSNNTFLGFNSGPGTSTQLTNATAIGSDALVNANNTIQLGNASLTTVNVGTGTTAKLVTGSLQVTGGTLTAGNVLTSDGTGNAIWQAAGAGSGWSLTGNGTVTAANFLGSTNDIPLTFKVNNLKAGYIDNTTGGTFNTYLGMQAGNITTGVANSFFGYQAGKANTTGANNAAFGKFSMTNNIGGTDNAAYGYQSLMNNTDASSNTALGRSAMFTMSFANAGTSYNTNNTGIGYQALYNTNPTSLANGKFNTSLGYNSGQANTTGTSNTFVGSAADASSGTFTNATAIGANASVNASNKVRIGDASVTVIEGQVAFTAASDKRFKTDIKPINEGLEFVKQLKPVSFRLKADESGKSNWGFIAQDIEALLGTKNAVLTVGGDSLRSLGLRYSDFVAPLVKAVQEQQKMIDNLQNKVSDRDKKIAELEASLKAIQSESNSVEQLRAEVEKIKKALGLETTAKKD